MECAVASRLLYPSLLMCKHWSPTVIVNTVIDKIVLETYFVLHTHTHTQRPTAHELLRHRFLRQARKTSYLMELTERYRRWKAEGGDNDSMEDKTEYDGEGGRLVGGEGEYRERRWGRNSLAPNTLLRNLPLLTGKPGH